MFRTLFINQCIQVRSDDHDFKNRLGKIDNKHLHVKKKTINYKPKYNKWLLTVEGGSRLIIGSLNYGYDGCMSETVFDNGVFESITESLTVCA